MSILAVAKNWLVVLMGHACAPEYEAMETVMTKWGNKAREESGRGMEALYGHTKRGKEGLKEKR